MGEPPVSRGNWPGAAGVACANSMNCCTAGCASATAARGTAEPADFRALLELPDPDIAAYLLGPGAPEDQRLRLLILQIREHAPATR